MLGKNQIPFSIKSNFNQFLAITLNLLFICLTIVWVMLKILTSLEIWYFLMILSIIVYLLYLVTVSNTSTAFLINEAVSPIAAIKRLTAMTKTKPYAKIILTQKGEFNSKKHSFVFDNFSWRDVSGEIALWAKERTYLWFKVTVQITKSSDGTEESYSTWKKSKLDNFRGDVNNFHITEELCIRGLTECIFVRRDINDWKTGKFGFIALSLFGMYFLFYESLDHRLVQEELTIKKIVSLKRDLSKDDSLSKFSPCFLFEGTKEEVKDPFGKLPPNTYTQDSPARRPKGSFSEDLEANSQRPFKKKESAFGKENKKPVLSFLRSISKSIDQSEVSEEEMEGLPRI